jgi:ribonucleotide monophosphatase NagD (HAD superfamily)
VSERLDAVEALLLDLSGVLYVQEEAVPGAHEALERLGRRMSAPPGSSQPRPWTQSPTYPI